VTLSRQSIDYTALPAALLDDFKAWARIDHTDDDRGLSLILARAIELLERQFGVCIAPSVWTWRPVVDAMAGNRLACGCYGAPAYSANLAPVPLRGVVAFTVMRGDVPDDVSSQFELVGGDDTFAQLYLASAEGVGQSDVVQLETGQPIDPDKFPPALMDVVFRYALFLWENRESAPTEALATCPTSSTAHGPRIGRRVYESRPTPRPRAHRSAHRPKGWHGRAQARVVDVVGSRRTN
jgi:hypothetical protein